MAVNSDITMDIHTPYRSKIRGNVNTKITCKSKALVKERSAEITPLFKAVKKEEPNKFTPAKR